MAARILTQAQQSLSCAALAGTWKLGAGCAITLQPGEAGVLKVAHGQLWVTLDGPHRGPLNDLGDRVMGTGDQLRLSPGERLVIEPWGGGTSAYFGWDPLPATVASPSRRWSPVVQPLADLRLALALAAGALARLAFGLAGLVGEAVAGRRATLADCAFNAQSRACRAHGAMS